MIESNSLLPLLVEAYPGVRQRLVATVDQWLTDDGSISPCAVFGDLSTIVAERFEAGEFDGAEQLFELVERCIVQGSEEVAAGATTCFLEGIINRAGTGSLAVHFMGPQSKSHCRAWDKFTGVKTQGL